MSKKYPLPKRIIDIHNHLWRDDPDGDRLIAIMDKARIETTLIMGVKAAGGVRSNGEVLKACRRHKGRLVPGAYLDPRDGKKAVDGVRRYYDKGVRVIKLFPNYGYFPDDPKCKPFFAAIDKLGLAVLSHCGWLSPQPGVATAAYYAHPGRFEKVIRIFTNTTFILAHMGGIAGYLETVMLTTRTPNTFVDCSPGQGLLVMEKGGPMVGAIPPEKLMFGADSLEQELLIPRYAKAMEQHGFGPHFEKIYYSNAQGLLKKIGAL